MSCTYGPADEQRQEGDAEVRPAIGRHRGRRPWSERPGADRAWLLTSGNIRGSRPPRSKAGADRSGRGSMRIRRIALLVLGLATCGVVHAADGPYPKGLPQMPESFPLAVWLQAPANAERYRAIGINTYVAIYRGPTEEQLAALDEAGIRLICGQNERSLRFKD